MNNTEHKQKILPVLQTVVDRLKVCKEFNLTNVTFVCIQHLLFTTVDLIKSLIMLGAKPSNIHIMGKIYSTCPDVVGQIIKLGVVYYHYTQPQQLGSFNDFFNRDIANMWNKVSSTLLNTKSNTIIILDDGSKCIANIPKSLSDNYTVFAVEQTSSGIAHIKKNSITVPLINVAFSAAKQLLESPMIARAVATKLDKFLSLYSGGFTSGVVGLGVIGRAVVQKLLSFNHKVLVYDKIKEKCNFINSVNVVNSTQLLFQEADYIFGCTGEDISISININEIQGIKNLISCSSQDIEFQSLLKIIQNNYSNTVLNVLSNLCLPLDNGIIKIYRGGYPINLDNSGESVPAKDIQLTRGLLLGGIIQAIFQLIQEPKPECKEYMLDTKIQKLIVQELMVNGTEQISHESLVMNFLDKEWIKNNSVGCFMEKPIVFPENLFNTTS